MKIETIQITDKEDVLFGKYIHTVFDDKQEVSHSYSSDYKTPFEYDSLYVSILKKYNDDLTRNIS